MKEILIPESEMEVMKVLWARSPQSLPEIVENVRRTMPWEAVTVKTLLGRLVKKECVRRSGSRRSYLYEPLIDRAAVLKSATKRFLEKMFDGTPGAMLSFFLYSGDLSKDEIEELSRLIEEMKR